MACAVIGSMAVLLGFPSPLCIWQNMVVSGLFFFGFACSQKGWMIYLTNPVNGVVSILIMIGSLILGISVGCQAFAINEVSFYYPFVFLFGITMICFIAHNIKETKLGGLIAYIGDYSFSIMTFHFLSFKLVTFSHSLIDRNVDIKSFPTSEVDLIIWFPLYLIAGIAIPIICVNTCNTAYAWYHNRRLQESE